MTVCVSPLNTNWILQSCTEGIVSALEALFQKAIFSKVLWFIKDREDKSSSAHNIVKKFNMLQVTEILTVAFETVKSENIVNLWKRRGFGNVDERFNKEAIAVTVPDEVLRSNANGFVAFLAVNNGAKCFEERRSEKTLHDQVQRVAATKTRN